jgi:hypothetical protein
MYTGIFSKRKTKLAKLISIANYLMDVLITAKFLSIPLKEVG